MFQSAEAREIGTSFARTTSRSIAASDGAAFPVAWQAGWVGAQISGQAMTLTLPGDITESCRAVEGLCGGARAAVNSEGSLTSAAGASRCRRIKALVDVPHLRLSVLQEFITYKVSQAGSSTTETSFEGQPARSLTGGGEDLQPDYRLVRPDGEVRASLHSASTRSFGDGLDVRLADVGDVTAQGTNNSAPGVPRPR